MKIAALQPPYPYRPADMPALVEWLTTHLDECDASLDLIVLPEACDAMSSYPDYAAFEADVEAYCQPLLDKARDGHSLRRAGGHQSVQGPEGALPQRHRAV